jgi:hypothetical protein
MNKAQWTGPVMDERPESYVIREPETVERKVLHRSGIRPHGPARPRPLGRPWPRQVAWQDRLTARRRRLALARGDLREVLDQDRSL